MDNKIRNWINNSKLGYFDWNGIIVDKQKLELLLDNAEIYLNEEMDILEVGGSDWFNVWAIENEWELKVARDIAYWIEEDLSGTFVMKHLDEVELISKEELIDMIIDSERVIYCDVTDRMMIENSNGYYCIEAW